MKRFARLAGLGTTGLLCALLIAGGPTVARAGNWNTELFPSRPDYISAGNLSLLGGVRVLDEDDWAPVDKPLQFGLDFDYTKRAWPLGIGVCATFLAAWADESDGPVDVKLNVYEGQLGLRKVWYQSAWLRPYLGAGGTVVSARAVVDMPDSRSRTRDVGFGGWVGGGLYVVLAKNVHVGVDARWGYANVTLNGNDTNAVGLQVQGLVGWYFGD